MVPVESVSAGEAWEKSIQLFLRERLELLDGGSIGGPYVEVSNLVITVTAPDAAPRVSPRFAYPQTIFELPGDQGQGDFEEARLILERMQRWRLSVERSFDQLAHVLETLRRAPGSRRAVVSLWDPAIDAISQDAICPCFLQFRIDSGLKPAVSLTVLSRSCDAWIGAPVDLVAFCSMLCNVATDLGLPPGALTYHVVSYHLYQHDLAAARHAFA